MCAAYQRIKFFSISCDYSFNFAWCPLDVPGSRTLSCGDFERPPDKSASILNVSGKSTGFVVTSRVTHASPAPLYAVSPDRAWENDAKLPRRARQHGCKDIGAQLADPIGNKIDVSSSQKSPALHLIPSCNVLS